MQLKLFGFCLINHFPLPDCDGYRKSKNAASTIHKGTRMLTQHKIILGNSQQMPELADGCVQLMVTSPPYPMIKMWDALFA
ncbi:MAG: hypothetical protein ABSB10_07115 [Candidatus Bathyarchaeia archaeon]